MNKSILLATLIASVAIENKGSPGVEGIVRRAGNEVFRIVVDKSGNLVCTSGSDLKGTTVSKIGRHPLNSEAFEIMPTLVSVETGTPIHVRLTKNADYLIITDKNGVELGKWYAGGNKLVVQNIPDTTKECGKQS